MDTRILIPIITVVVAFIVVAAVMITRSRESKHLKQQFGPEYDRTVKMHGDPRHAEAVLLEREKRVEFARYSQHKRVLKRSGAG